MDISIDDLSSRTTTFSCNPVNYATGTMMHEFVDVSLRGKTKRTPLVFKRTYSTNTFSSLSDLGTNWIHNYQTRLITKGKEHLDLGRAGEVYWINEGGGKSLFKKTSDGKYIGPPSVFHKLVEFADRYEIQKVGGMKLAFGKAVKGIPDGRLMYIEEPHGERISFDYDNQSRLIEAYTGLAGSLVFSYDNKNRIQEVHRVRDNLSYHYSYDLDGRLASVSDFNNLKTSFNYVEEQVGTKAHGLLNKITDPLGRTIEFEYYNDGRVFSEKDKGGGVVTYIYALYLEDHFTRVKSTDGYFKQFSYDDDYRLVEKRYADGAIVRQKWDEKNNLVSTFDELGYETKFEYDARGNKTGVKEPECKGYRRTQYDLMFDVPIKITPLVDAETTNIIDPNTGDVVKTSRPYGTSEVFLEYTYDQFGNVIKTTNNYASYSNATNNDGLYVSIYDARNTEAREYDNRGRLKVKSYLSGRTISYTYDDYDRVVRIDDSHGPSTINEYDVVGRLIVTKVTDGVTEKVTSREYDNKDRLVAVIDPLNRRTEYEYDKEGLGCRDITDKPVRVIDPKGRTTYYEFDKRNRVTRIIKPDNSVERREYNVRGDLIAVTDSNGGRTRFFYDGNRRLIRKERPSVVTGRNGEVKSTVAVTTYVYDDDNHLLREEIRTPSYDNGTNEAKLVIRYEYNPFGQMVKKAIVRELLGQDIVEEESIFEYKKQMDAVLRVRADNNVQKMAYSYEHTPPFSMVSYKVEAADKENPLGIIEGIFNLTPGVVGGVKTMERDGTKVLERETDPVGRLRKISGIHNGKRYELGINYNSYGLKESVITSDGSVGNYVYDQLNRMTSISWSGTENFSEDLTYAQKTGVVSGIQREIGDFIFNHDEKNDQLISSSYIGALPLDYDRNYAFDYNGNRTFDSKWGNGAYMNNSIVRTDRYRYYTDKDGQGKVSQRTDELTGAIDLYESLDDGKVRKYEKYERIPNLTKTVEASYFYDALGRRVAKKIDMRGNQITQTFSHYADQDKILFAKRGDGKENFYIDGDGIDEHFGMIEDRSLRYFLTDHLGTVVNGNVTGDVKLFGAFGELLGDEPKITTESDPVAYGYTGRSYDAESGLYYYRARYYDPETGRFMSVDPMGINGGDVNLYRYVNNMPLLLLDPLGLFVGPGISPEMFAEYSATPQGGAAISTNMGRNIPSNVRYVQVGMDVVDTRHAAAAFQTTQSLMNAGLSSSLAGAATKALGVGVEVLQYAGAIGQSGSGGSGFSPEDLMSNSVGVAAAQAGYSSIAGAISGSSSASGGTCE